jgi:hypothetical protein
MVARHQRMGKISAIILPDPRRLPRHNFAERIGQPEAVARRIVAGVQQLERGVIKAAGYRRGIIFWSGGISRIEWRPNNFPAERSQMHDTLARCPQGLIRLLRFVCKTFASDSGHDAIIDGKSVFRSGQPFIENQRATAVIEMVAGIGAKAQALRQPV